MSAEMTLTESDRANLRWMKILNDEFGTSLYWPTVRKRGTVPECEVLVTLGLAERGQDRQGREEQGYWITDEGRSALSIRERGE